MKTELHLLYLEKGQRMLQEQESLHLMCKRTQMMSLNVDYAPVKMVVVDGIVMGPTHCAYGDCTSALGNA